MEYQFEPRKINPARLCFGLANIGYKSFAAIEDIIDNSVGAKAKKIEIHIEVSESKTLTEKGSIARIRIIDNGNGMNNEVIRKALDIGSDVEYDSQSLSKYGLGLKSAGLSLGERIQVYSKTETDGFSHCLTLDLETIRTEEDYGVIISETSEAQRNHLSGYHHGTVIDISEIINHDTVNLLKNKLIERLGVLYYEFIISDDPLVFSIHIKDKVFNINARDILYRDNSNPAFDEYDYDCKTPCKLLIGKEIDIPNAPAGTPPVILNLSVFPQAKMATYSGFSPEERAIIKGYGVSLSNSGFFIYRNNRLIRWGDNLSIVDRDLRTLRGRIDITTEHDELLNVDVSKQNLDLPEEFLDSLALVCRIPKDDAIKATKKCSSKFESNEDKEGESASDTVIDVIEEDPDTYIEEVDEEDKKARRAKIIKDTSASSNDDEESDDVKIKKIVYKDYLLSQTLWDFRLDPEYGTIVHINKAHPFYQLVLKSLNAADPKRQAIECFIYCLAVGEIKTKENLHDIDFEDIQKVMKKYNVVVSWNLQNWSAHNQNLFD